MSTDEKKQMSTDISANNAAIEKVSQLIKTTKYGVVSIVIQDSKVIQIEKTEKFRLNKSDSKTER